MVFELDSFVLCIMYLSLFILDENIMS